MSITFSPALYPTLIGYQVTCWADHVLGLLPVDAVEAPEAQHCVECGEEVQGFALGIYEGPELPSVNLSNTNALMILERLGYEADYYGSVDADDLLGRALTMNVGRDDSGTDSTVDEFDGTATIIECGVRPGYFESVAERLAEVAASAKENGVEVSWG